MVIFELPEGGFILADKYGRPICVRIFQDVETVEEYCAEHGYEFLSEYLD